MVGFRPRNSPMQEAAGESSNLIKLISNQITLPLKREKKKMRPLLEMEMSAKTPQDPPVASEAREFGLSLAPLY